LTLIGRSRIAKRGEAVQTEGAAELVGAH